MKREMESYQSVGIVMSVVGIIIAIALGAVPTGDAGVNGFIVIDILFVSFIGLILSLLNIKHHKKVGVVMVVLGIIGNLLLIIPGIMAIRYKTDDEKFKKQTDPLTK